MGTKTHIEFINEFENQNKYASHMTIVGTYKNANTKIEYICNDCGETHFSTPNELIRDNRWCRPCSKKRMAQESLSERRKNFYEKYSMVDDNSLTLLGEYISAKTKIPYVCNKCGHKDAALPDNLIRGHKCRKCGAKLRGKNSAKTHNQYVKEVNEKYPNYIILSKYTRDSESITVRCIKCNSVWECIAGNLLSCGCPFCSGRRVISGINDDKSNLEYIVNNYKSSLLSNIFDLSTIDWVKCGEYATKNIIKDVCDFFIQNNTLTIKQIAKLFKVSDTSIRKYLTIGNEFGWCNYNAKEHYLKTRKNNNISNNISNIKINTDITA